MPKPGFDLESRLTKGQNPVPITVLRRLFILLIAAWLPLQGASALAMPYGGAGGKPADLAQAAEPDASTAHWHDGKGLHGGHDSHVMSAARLLQEWPMMTILTPPQAASAAACVNSSMAA